MIRKKLLLKKPKKKKKKPDYQIIIPKGYELEEIFDIDDSDFNEKPIKVEEVKITFGN